jgi:hypothetical protein
MNRVKYYKEKLEIVEDLINYLASALYGQNNNKNPVEMQEIAKKMALTKFEKYEMILQEKWQPVEWELASEFTDEGIVISVKVKE